MNLLKNSGSGFLGSPKLPVNATVHNSLASNKICCTSQAHIQDLHATKRGRLIRLAQFLEKRQLLVSEKVTRIMG